MQKESQQLLKAILTLFLSDVQHFGPNPIVAFYYLHRGPPSFYAKKCQKNTVRYQKGNPALGERKARPLTGALLLPFAGLREAHLICLHPPFCSISHSVDSSATDETNAVLMLLSGTHVFRKGSNGAWPVLQGGMECLRWFLPKPVLAPTQLAPEVSI